MVGPALWQHTRLYALLLCLAVAACSRPAGPLDVSDGTSRAGAAAPSSPKVVTSGDDPSAPVPFLWTTFRSHSPDGQRLVLQGGTLHSIPSEVRLLDPSGQVVAMAQTSTTAPAVSCIDGPGLAHALLPVSSALLPLFDGDVWPGYRLEARVGGVWRPVAPSPAGCRVTE